MSKVEELIAKSQAGDMQAKETLISENSGLIWSVTRRFLGRGAEADDMYQLACLGFLKAVDGFDLNYGTQFSTYAVPKIAGEIRRFLRDDGTVKVARGLREQAQKIYAARESLRSKMQREPTLTELAEHTGLGVEEIAYAEIAVSAPESLQQENAEGLTLESLLGTDSPEEQMVESIALRQAVTMLPEQERMTVALRFYRGFTQAKTARVLKVSQVQVSRLERRAMLHLREILQAEE